MRGCNTDTYSKATTLLYEISPKDPQATPDTGWVEKRNKENKRETERLEQELKGYKNNLIKESIRVRPSIMVVERQLTSPDGPGRYRITLFGNFRL